MTSAATLARSTCIFAGSGPRSRPTRRNHSIFKRCAASAIGSRLRPARAEPHDVDAARRIAFANASVGPLVGNLHGALQGQTLMASLRDYEADQAVERALGTGETQSATFHTPRSGRMLRLTCQPLSDGAGAVVVLRD